MLVSRHKVPGTVWFQIEMKGITNINDIQKVGQRTVPWPTLGMWIRNTWIYGNEEERVEALAKDFGEDSVFLISADDLSSAILDGYKKHLRKRAKNKK